MTPLITLFNSEESISSSTRVLEGLLIVPVSPRTQFNFDDNSAAVLSAELHVYTDGLQFPAGWQTIASSQRSERIQKDGLAPRCVCAQYTQ